MGRVLLTKAPHILDSEMGTITTGLQKLGIEDKLNEMSIRKVNASGTAVAPYFRTDERGPLRLALREA